MMRKRDMAMYGVALLLAFVVGTLVGGRCAPAPPTDAEPVPEVVQCDPIREVVYECPPEPAVTESAPVKGGKPSPKPSATELPTALKPITPKQRKQLLAWVRDQSADLERCRSAAKDTYRLTVTLELDEKGAVKKVRLNVPATEVPSEVRSCLRDRMLGWSPPADLVDGRRELVFGLTL